ATPATELLEQGAALACADAGNFLEPTGLPRLLATPAMAGDRETMRLVADLLDQLERGRCGAGLDLDALLRQPQGFLAWFAFRPLGHAHQAQRRDAQFGKHRLCLRDLSLAAIDQQHIRQVATLVDGAPERRVSAWCMAA